MLLQGPTTEEIGSVWRKVHPLDASRFPDRFVIVPRVEIMPSQMDIDQCSQPESASTLGTRKARIPRLNRLMLPPFIVRSIASRPERRYARGSGSTSPVCGEVRLPGSVLIVRCLMQSTLLTGYSSERRAKLTIFSGCVPVKVLEDTSMRCRNSLPASRHRLPQLTLKGTSHDQRTTVKRLPARYGVQASAGVTSFNPASGTWAPWLSTLFNKV